MRFSATEAAFEGFRLVRRNPMALVFWTLAYLVLSVANVAAMIVFRDRIVEGMRILEGFESNPPTSMADFTLLFDAYGQMSSYSLVVLPVSIIVGAMLSAAVARGVLTPEARRFGYLRLGMDEVRVFVVTLVLGILSAMIAFAAFMAAMVLGGVAVVSGQGWMWALVLAAVLAGLGLVIWLAVRWSLAVPITVSERKFAFFDSFRVTRGRFWPLLGMAIIAGVMSVLIWMLSMVVVMPLGMLSGMGAMGLNSSDPAVIIERLTLSNPLIFLSALANAIVYALMVGILYAPFAAAWRDLKGQ